MSKTSETAATATALPDMTPMTGADHVLQALRSRRSVRNFKAEPVPEELLLRAMEHVRFSPTPTNRQCFRFLQVDDPLLLQTMRQDVLRKVDEMARQLEGDAGKVFREYAKWFSFFDQAPLVIFGLYRTFGSRLPDNHPKGRTLIGLAEMQALGGAIHALMLALHAQGLGTCWMSGPLVADVNLEHLLQIEKPWRIGAVVPVGWPVAQPAVPSKPAVADIYQRYVPGR